MMPADATSRDHASSSTRPSKTNATTAAHPTRTFFDPWNSSSTGHQRAENRLSGSTSWRESRTLKLAAQLTGGQTGGARLYDTVGAGSENFGKDGRKESGGWERGASGLREKGQRTIVEALGAKTAKAGVKNEKESEQTSFERFVDEDLNDAEGGEIDCTDRPAEDAKPLKPQIFRNLCIYINGSTAPLVSDHKLKHLLAEHGARMSIALGRRTVTHVILGTGCRQGGVGGGLAGGKIQREISRVGGKGVKFVGVEWVIESIRAGKRLPEAQFSNLKLASKGQQSVYGMFKRSKAAGKTESDNG